MSSIVRVNGQSFNILKGLQVVRSLDTMIGQANLTVSKQPVNNSFLKNSDLVQIILDGFPRCTGYVESYDDTESISDHNISYSLRDTACDLVDSTVPVNMIFNEGAEKISKVIEDLLSGLGINGIKVIDQNNYTYSAVIPTVGEVGQTCGDYIDNYARIIGAFINTDGKGNIIMYQLGTENPTKLIFKQGEFSCNNILEATLKIDNSQRFYKYIFWNQGAVITDKAGNYEVSSYAGIAYDKEVRQTRVLEVMADLGSQDVQLRAEQERNLRRGRSYEYTCTVSGYSANGMIWEIGQLVNIYDDERQVYGWFIIKAVTYKLDLQRGETTEIICTLPETYYINITQFDNNQYSITRNFVQSSAFLPAGKARKGDTVGQTTGDRKSD